MLDGVLAQHARPGLRLPTTATSDGAPGSGEGDRGVLPDHGRIRCWFHRLANIRAKLPDEAAGEVLAHVYAVRDAPTLDAARAAADRFTNTYARDYRAAVACFTDDLDALLNIHRVPVRHRIRVRTNNLCGTLLRRGTPPNQSHPPLQ